MRKCETERNSTESLLPKHKDMCAGDCQGFSSCGFLRGHPVEVEKVKTVKEQAKKDLELDSVSELLRDLRFICKLSLLKSILVSKKAKDTLSGLAKMNEKSAQKLQKRKNDQDHEQDKEQGLESVILVLLLFCYQSFIFLSLFSMTNTNMDLYFFLKKISVSASMKKDAKQSLPPAVRRSLPPAVRRHEELQNEYKPAIGLQDQGVGDERGNEGWGGAGELE